MESAEQEENKSINQIHNSANTLHALEFWSSNVFSITPHRLVSLFTLSLVDYWFSHTPKFRTEISVERIQPLLGKRIRIHLHSTAVLKCQPQPSPSPKARQVQHSEVTTERADPQVALTSQAILGGQITLQGKNQNYRPRKHSCDWKWHWHMEVLTSRAMGGGIRAKVVKCCSTVTVQMPETTLKLPSKTPYLILPPKVKPKIILRSGWVKLDGVTLPLLTEAGIPTQRATHHYKGSSATQTCLQATATFLFSHNINLLPWACTQWRQNLPFPVHTIPPSWVQSYLAILYNLFCSPLPALNTTRDLSTP